jgi:hypothetical protein
MTAPIRTLRWPKPEGEVHQGFCGTCHGSTEGGDSGEFDGELDEDRESLWRASFVSSAVLCVHYALKRRSTDAYAHSGVSHRYPPGEYTVLGTQRLTPR